MTTITALALLRRARHALDTGREEFICHAIDNAVDADDEKEQAVAVMLRQYIADGLMIGHRRLTTLSCWVYDTLSGKFGIGYAESWYLGDGVEDREALARLAWVDKMIDNLETKGTLA